LLVAFYIYRTRFSSTGQRGDTWLLLGPMGAGKTALFFRLKQGLFRPTQTSMKENDAVFVPQELQSASKGGAIAPTRFVDLPGHPSQRVKLDALKPVAKGVVFVLDGAHTDSLGKTSQLLYTLLVDPIFVARRTPFFIAINKADLLENGGTATDDASPSSSSSSSEDDDAANADSLEGRVEALTRRLEGLLDKTRSLQSTMSDLGDDASSSSSSGPRVLGRQGETFRLEHSICPIEVGAISAAKGTLEPLLEFLQAH
jgi:signal recognition particle receptor subunit beta